MGCRRALPSCGSPAARPSCQTHSLTLVHMPARPPVHFHRTNRTTATRTFTRRRWPSWRPTLTWRTARRRTWRPQSLRGGAWGRVGACVAHGLLRCSGLNPGLAVPNPHPRRPHPAPRRHVRVWRAAGRAALAARPPPADSTLACSSESSCSEPWHHHTQGPPLPRCSINHFPLSLLRLPARCVMCYSDPCAACSVDSCPLTSSLRRWRV